MAKIQNVRGTYDLYGEAKRKTKKVIATGAKLSRNTALKKLKLRFSSLPKFFPQSR